MPLRPQAASPRGAGPGGPENYLQTDVAIIEVSRTPRDLLRALGEREEIRTAERALQQKGLATKLDSGANVMVAPNQYEAVQQATRGLKLKCRHWIVPVGNVEETFASIVASLPSKLAVRIKSRIVLDGFSLQRADQGRSFREKNGFWSDGSHRSANSQHTV